MSDWDLAELAFMTAFRNRCDRSEKQLREAARSEGIVINASETAEILECSHHFVRSSTTRPHWRLATVQTHPGATEFCAACGAEQPTSHFEFPNASHPVCLECELTGQRPKLPASIRPGSVSFAIRTRAGGPGGSVEAWDQGVYITKGGEVYHHDEDCSARRNGQAEAISMGWRAHPVRFVTRRSAGDRRPCQRCAQ